MIKGLMQSKNHSYHNFYKQLFEFCSVDLSSFYFDISKDIFIAILCLVKKENLL